MEKSCRICEEVKPLTDYYPKKTTRDRYTTQCKDCHNALARKRYEDRKYAIIDVVSAICNICGEDKPAADFQRDPTKANGLRGHCRACQREKHLAREYGMTLAQYAEMFVAQDGVCEICKEPSEKTLAVDHCHATGKVRGLLCGDCNTSIGLMREDIKRLAAAIKYLEESN